MYSAFCNKGNLLLFPNLISGNKLAFEKRNKKVIKS